MESAENTDESDVDSDPETPLKEGGEDIVDGGVLNKTATIRLADM